MFLAEDDIEIKNHTDDFQSIIGNTNSETSLNGIPTEKQIGPYKFTSSLGEGSMGQVYLAERNDGKIEQKVALKMPHFSFNTQMLQRFENKS